MFFRLLVSIACLHVVQDFRLKKHRKKTTHKVAFHEPTASETSNEFSKKYANFHLGTSLEALRHWQPRVNLEAEGVELDSIVDRFFEAEAANEDKANEDKENEEKNPWDVFSPTEVRQYANLAAAQGGFPINSPLEISRTLYGILIRHLPKAEYAELYKKEGVSPVSDFIGHFRKNSVEERFLGVEHRFTTWVWSLHGITRNHLIERGDLYEGKLPAGGFCKWVSYKVGSMSHGGHTLDVCCAARSKFESVDCPKIVDNPFSMWLTMLLRELQQVESDLRKEWIPKVSTLYEEIEKDIGSLSLIDLPSPITVERVSSLQMAIGISFLDEWWKAPTTKTLKTLLDADRHGVLSGEFDQMKETFKDLIVSCRALRSQLQKDVEKHASFAEFELMQNPATTNASKKELLAWAKGPWDDVGIVIPGDESTMSKKLRKLKGIVVVPLLPTGQPNAVGFEFESAGAKTTKLLKIVTMNVKAVLGGKMYQFLQLSNNVGSEVALQMTDPRIPSMISPSARVFRYKIVQNMASYEPAFSELVGLEGSNQSDSVWYEKELVVPYLVSGLVQGGMEKTVSSPTGEAVPASLFETDNTGNLGQPLGSLLITYAAQHRLAQVALGIA